jgi:glycosyltransferase involved in cell wall biosynthesis
VLPAPAIVDIDDLRDDLNLLRFEAFRNDGDRAGVTGFLKHRQARRNAALWSRLQRLAARSVEAVVVCSEEDRQRLGVPNGAVIPNGYAEPNVPLGRAAVGEPPTILLQGMLNYPPNADAARYLVDRILPRVRQRLPSAQVRIVGRTSEAVERLAERPGVVVTGRVPEIETELARSDLVAVPIRFGGGTRIKILEAFAHRLPVVSTSIGAHGLDAVHGSQLLIADDADRFAEACVRLLTDRSLRDSLAGAAHALFVERYRWTTIGQEVKDLVMETVDGSDPRYQLAGPHR